MHTFKGTVPLCAQVVAFLLFVVSARSERRNVLLVIVDNLRPSLGCYGQTEIKSPNIDGLAKQGVLFTQAYCQVAWCSPSRNSFLTGRRPDAFKVYGFRRSFRDVDPSVVTLPEYLKDHGFYTSSIGKTFHPRLPQRFDYPRSWSDEPFFVEKRECKGRKMSCGVGNISKTVDFKTTQAAVRRLQGFVHRQRASEGAESNFFIVVGYQAPRLPWVYPESIARRLYGNLSDITVTRHVFPGSMSALEWFRPNEIDIYSDIRNVSYSNPVDRALEQALRRAYYATISHVDQQVGRLLNSLKRLGLKASTHVILVADHGQNLGEFNMWSMMNLLEPSLQVPLIIKLAESSRIRYTGTYDHPVELIDLFPTIVTLSGLPKSKYLQRLPGISLVKKLGSNTPAKRYAYSQITRCSNCSLAYKGTLVSCLYDEAEDDSFTVPCAMTPLNKIDFMGYSLRSVEGWRYTLFCKWNQSRLSADFHRCGMAELYNLSRTEAFDPEFDYNNLAGREGYEEVERELRDELVRKFGSSGGKKKPSPFLVLS